MDIILALIPISFILLITATSIFLWAMKSGQYDDLEGPAHRILHDDDDPAHQAAIKNNKDNPPTDD